MESLKPIAEILVPLAASSISLVSVLALVFFWRQQNKEAVRSRLSIVWHELMSVCHRNPEYLDVFFTEDYENKTTPEELHRYDAYCYKAWTYVREIVEKGYEKKDEYSLICGILAKYHYRWLEKNPVFFGNPRFWKVVDEHRENPHLIFGYRNIPTKEGEVDFGQVGKEDYHRYILSPLAPEMTAPDETGRIRNRLLVRLREKLNRGGKRRIVDLGCGPGNLLPHLTDHSARINELACLDKSKPAARRAAEVGKKLGLPVRTICADMAGLIHAIRSRLIR